MTRRTKPRPAPKTLDEMNDALGEAEAILAALAEKGAEDAERLRALAEKIKRLRAWE